MSILIYQSLGGKGDKHLIGMATAERFGQGLLGFLDHFLDCELVVATLKPRNYEQQRPLPIRCTSPSPGKEVCVEFLFNLRSGNRRSFPLINPLNERVVHLPADELDEVWIAAGHVDYRVDGVVTKTHRALSIFYWFPNCLFAFRLVETLQEHGL